MLNYTELDNLCKKNAPSGFEKEVREYIISEIKDFADSIDVDALGNIIAFKKGKNRRNNGLAFCVPMDETGLIVNGFTFSGDLYVKPLGKIQADDVICHRVAVGENRLNGIIGTKPTHILKEEERKEEIPLESMVVDIGAVSEETAKEHINIGDVVCFCEPFCESDCKVMSKALERIGCFLLINLIRQPLMYDTHFVFTTLSHINGAGIKTALFNLDIKNAVIINEISQNKENSLDGVILPVISKNTVYSKKLIELARKISSDCRIVCDDKQDLESICLAMLPKNIDILRVSYPTVYPDSVLKTAKKSDIEAVLSIISDLLNCSELS